MKRFLFLVSLAFLFVAMPAGATVGNNGEGNGGCGVGQQTNGCGPSDPTPPVIVVGPKGDKGDTGATGAAGKDGKDGKDAVAVNGTNGTNGTNGESIKGDKGEQGVQGQNAPDAVTVQQMTGAVAAAQAQTTGQINALREELHGVAKAAYSGVAAALALHMPTINPVKPEALVMRLGVGSYKGQSAVGISFRKSNKAGDWSFTGGVSATSGGGTGLALGVEHSF